jgi:hypothetical protein
MANCITSAAEPFLFYSDFFIFWNYVALNVIWKNDCE